MYCTQNVCVFTGQIINNAINTIDTDGQPCTGKISLDDQDQTYCRQCRTTRNLDLLLAITGADNAAPVWVDGEAAAKQSRIPERTIRRWASRGWITRSHGRYDLRVNRRVV